MKSARQAVYRGSKATKVNLVSDAPNITRRYTTGGSCPKCGAELAQKLERHIEKCETLPSSEEISEMLKDPRQSIESITRTYNGFSQRFIGILLMGDNDWTREKLKEHGYRAKVLNEKDGREKRLGGKRRHITVEGPRCECGILVEAEGEACEWCVMESHGIKSYHDMHGV